MKKSLQRKQPPKPPAGRVESAGSPAARVALAGSPAARVARHRGKAEELYHGVRECEAIFARRPQEIVRVYVAEPQRKRWGSLLAWCAKERKGYQLVGADNLQRLTGSLHHEGIAILAKAIRRWTLAELLAAIEKGRCTGPLVYLDGVQNPHNLGSILRTAAHFGAAAILGRSGELPPLSPAAVRVAEGAAEIVAACDVADPPADLARLKKAGYSIVAASSGRGESVYAAKLSKKSVIVLGSEGHGISKGIDAVADRRVKIPGTGAVESLNVSVACGILLSEAV